MKTLMLLGLILLSAITAQCQYFQRHVGSRFAMNYIDTTTSLSSFKATLPVFKQLTLADSVDNSKTETSERAVFRSSSLEKSIQYNREYKKRKIDFSPVLHVLYSILEAQVVYGCKPF